MPGICKVGFTLRPIKERLVELNSSTSIPTKFEIEYAVELEEHFAPLVEKSAHKDLHKQELHHGKEYFKCSVNDCKNAIARAITKRGAVVLGATDAEETRKRIADEQGRRIAEQKKLEAEKAELARLAEIERQLVQKENEIAAHYSQQLERISDPGPFWSWWLGCGFATALVVGGMFNLRDGPAFLVGAFLGAIVAVAAREWRREQRTKEAAYVGMVASRDNAIAAVRKNVPKPVQPKAGGNNQLRPAGIGENSQLHIPPQTGPMKEPQVVAVGIADHVRTSNARNAEIAKRTISTSNSSGSLGTEPACSETKTIQPAKDAECERLLRALESHPLATNYLRQLQQKGFIANKTDHQLVVTSPGGKQTRIRYVYELERLLSEMPATASPSSSFPKPTQKVCMSCGMPFKFADGEKCPECVLRDSRKA
jgi:hypothetical protein